MHCHLQYTIFLNPNQSFWFSLTSSDQKTVKNEAKKKHQCAVFSREFNVFIEPQKGGVSSFYEVYREEMKR